MFLRIFGQTSLFALAHWLVIRLVLDAEGLDGAGEYFFVLAVAAPVFMLLGANFRNYGSLPRYGRWSRLIGARLIGLATGFAGVLAIALFRNPVLAAVVGLLKGLEFLLDTIQALELRAFSVRWCFRGAAAFAVLALLLTIAPLREWTLPLLVAGCAILLLSIGILLANLTLRLGEDPPILLDGALFFDLVRTIGWPAFLVSITGTVPRVALEHFEGTAQLGIFGAFLYFYVPVHLVVVALFQAHSPRLRNMDPGGTEFLASWRRLALMVGAVGFAALALSVLLSEPAIRVAYGERLAPYHPLLPVFLGAVLIGAQATLQEQLLILANRRRPLVVLAWASLSFGLLACPLLTWRWGMPGTIAYLYLAAMLRVGILGYYLHRLRPKSVFPPQAANRSVLAP